MMKMSGRITSCCVVLLLTFTTVSAVQRVLRSINDLPMDSRELLHWFASEIDIDTNGIIQLTFDPDSGDYGSHHYGNYERLLDPLPTGYRYYTLGNINQQASLQVPSQGRNKARIIIRVMEQNAEWQAPQIIDQVYITQHYETFDYQRSAYDPEQTYQITTSLLREIRGVRIYIHDNLQIHHSNNFGSANNSQLSDTRNSQAPTIRNEQREFRSNQDHVSTHSHALVPVLVVGCILIIVILIIVILSTSNKK